MQRKLQSLEKESGEKERAVNELRRERSEVERDLFKEREVFVLLTATF